MNPRTKRRMSKVWAAALLFTLLLGMAAPPAYVQGLPTNGTEGAAPPSENGDVIPADVEAPTNAGAPADTGTPAGTEASEDVEAPADTAAPASSGEGITTPPDCTTPPSGRQAKLRAESEIVVVPRWEDSNDRLRYAVFDASGSGLARTGYESYGDIHYDVRWPAITTADLNGDGTPESVIAFRNQNNDLSARVPKVSDYWYSGNEDRHDGDVEYIDIAAGDLNRVGQDDEVVIAFRDDKDDLHLVGLNGNDAGGIRNGNNGWTWRWWSDSGGRGYVSQVAVATGDLDGDNYDDEIVTAFVDGNYDLQVQVFQASGSTFTNLWGKSWTNEDRGNLYAHHDVGDRRIDVTTGDVDGDFQDEIIVAFKDGYSSMRISTGKVQLLVLDRTSNWAFDDSTYVRIDPTQGYSLNRIDWVDPKAVSVTASDIDGDGKDEVSVGYDLFVRLAVDNKHTYPHLVTFDYAWPGPGGLLEREDSHWRGEDSPWNNVSRININSGDLDMDGRAEIAVAFRDADKNLRLLVFEGEDGLTQSRSARMATDPHRDLGDVWIAMGDVNGDSSFANYTGTCYEAQETQLTSLLHIPPHYSAYNRVTDSGGSAAAFGRTLGGGSSSGTSATTTQAGSITIDESISFADIFEVGPSYTYAFEKSLDISNELSTMHTDGLHISTDALSNVFDMVTFDKVTYWVYEYRESRSNQTFQLRIPKSYTSDSRRLDLWYSDGPTEFGNSWVPVGHNVALGRTATQSNTSYSGVASRAVDGNADGNYANNSVTHTPNEQYAWWQVDLGRSQWLDAVQLWNRTDCCGTRLSNFYVFVSDAPFDSTNPNTLVGDPNVWNYYHAGAAGRLTTVIPNRSGRYVRVQLAGSNNLSLAEVQVWGHPAEVKDSAGNRQWPIAAPTEIDDDTFQITLPDGTTQLVDGHLQWEWSLNNGIAVSRGGGFGTWDVQDDQEWVTSVETSTLQSVSIGFEAKVMGAGVEGSYTYGSETRASRGYMWSTGTQVEGQAGTLVYETTPPGINYVYSPYMWVQKAMSPSGAPQEFMVVDYWVDPNTSAQSEELPQPAAGQAITPTAPLVASPSHPDPATWYPSSTVVLTWTQSPGDPSTVAGYRWYLDSLPDTVPGPLDKGLTTTHTYEGVADGVWYAHVRAMSDGYQWSETGHRAVRVDTNPPQVTLALDPPQPTGNSGWYNTPLNVTVSASDGAGSGVASVEMSTDGSTWQPYAPLSFVTDTLTTTVWARATDAIGHTSDPVSATFKLDLTPPSSKIEIGEYTIGVWIATVITDTLGNQHLVMGGVIDDTTSGRAGMAIQANGGDWTSASAIGTWYPFPGQPQIEVNWYYTATTELGRGNHTFYGQAQDEAGNLEEPYQIAQVIWFPPSTPEVGASSLTVSPQVARPGDEVTFDIGIRNSGQQEAQIAIVDTLPAGLTPVTETLGYDAVYDAGVGTITWPARLVWPGQWAHLTFRARVDAAAAGVLENHVAAHAFWPNTDALTGAARQYFLDREDTTTMTATVTVDAGLPTGADVTPPHASLGIVGGSAVVTQPQIELQVWGDPDVQWMFLREWTPDPVTGAWTVAQDSGWMSYAPTTTWTLSPGDGVKYLGVWVADGARNVSLLDEGSLTYTNLVGSEQALPAGGRTQYRFEMGVDDLAAFYATTLAGDADLYIWKPLHAFRPNYWSNGPGSAGSVDAIVEWLDESGRYLVEVQAVGDSQYRLTIADESGLLPDRVSQTHLLSFDEKDRPMHPLTISDPLSAGAAGSPTALFHQIYLPLVTRNAAR